MGFHTYDPARADRLEDESRYRWCSGEELLTLLAPHGEATVADLGSGTGFYTDVVAPEVDTVYAVDVQPAMHDLYAEKGIPENVTIVTATVADLPFEDDSLDAAFSTMTYHEYSGPEATAELARVIGPGGHLVTVDWSRTGDGIEGAPRRRAPRPRPRRVGDDRRGLHRGPRGLAHRDVRLQGTAVEDGRESGRETAGNSYCSYGVVCSEVTGLYVSSSDRIGSSFVYR